MSAGGARRAFVVVLDACGCGALPDAADYGDAGANTLAHVAEAVGGLELPALGRLGLGNVVPLAGVPPAERPAIHGRLAPRGPGKDTMTGHWELMGVAAPDPRTYPDGFPPEVVATIERASGRRVLCNAPREGLAAIDEFGARHLASGELIVYTSADSVLQVAAHVDVVAEDELHAVCARVRAELPAEHRVGRVIARPFEGEPGAFRRRSAGRRDYALAPPARSHLDELAAAGVAVHSVGKVGQVFAGRGIAAEHPGHDNASAIESIDRLLAELDAGLVFANLVDTDTVHGHRKDFEGFHASLRATDAAVAGWIERMRAGDLLVLSADHGCDPAHPGTDHTREHVPLLAHHRGAAARRVDGAMARVGASAVRWLTGRDPAAPGEPFVA